MEPQDLKILDTFDSLLDIISTVKNLFRNGLKQVYNYRLFKIALTNYLPSFFDFQKLQNYHVGMKHLYEKLICFKLVSIHNYHFESKKLCTPGFPIMRSLATTASLWCRMPHKLLNIIGRVSRLACVPGVCTCRKKIET